VNKFQEIIIVFLLSSQLQEGGNENVEIDDVSSSRQRMNVFID
jgi:hypothetical protein